MKPLSAGTGCRKRPASRPWTRSEDAELVRAHVDGIGRAEPGRLHGSRPFRREPLASIAERLGRSRTAVEQRARKLGLERYRA